MTPYYTQAFRGNVNDMSDKGMSDNNLSDNDMSEVAASYTFCFTDMELSHMAETWLRYLNGPKAGTIDSQWVRREMPWLAGAAQRWTFRSS